MKMLAHFQQKLNWKFTRYTGKSIISRLIRERLPEIQTIQMEFMEDLARKMC